MTTSVVVLIVGFAVVNAAVVMWLKWSLGHRMQRIHHRLDILSHDLGHAQAELKDVEARVSVGEQERRWQEELRKVSEKF